MYVCIVGFRPASLAVRRGHSDCPAAPQVRGNPQCWPPLDAASAPEDPEKGNGFKISRLFCSNAPPPPLSIPYMCHISYFIAAVVIFYFCLLNTEVHNMFVTLQLDCAEHLTCMVFLLPFV